jgi:hypothetical protein
MVKLDRVAGGELRCISLRHRWKTGCRINLWSRRGPRISMNDSTVFRTSLLPKGRDGGRLRQHARPLTITALLLGLLDPIRSVKASDGVPDRSQATSLVMTKGHVRSGRKRARKGRGTEIGIGTGSNRSLRRNGQVMVMMQVRRAVVISPRQIDAKLNNSALLDRSAADLASVGRHKQCPPFDIADHTHSGRPSSCLAWYGNRFGC